MRFNLTLEDSIGYLLEKEAEQMSRDGLKVTAYDLIRQAVVEKYGSNSNISENEFKEIFPKNMIGYIKEIGTGIFDLSKTLFFWTIDYENPNHKTKCLEIEPNFFKTFFAPEKTGNNEYVFCSTKRFFAIKISSDQYLIRVLSVMETRNKTMEDILIDLPDEERIDLIATSELINNFFKITKYSN